jgi:hypothetical protein
MGEKDPLLAKLLADGVERQGFSLGLVGAGCGLFAASRWP